jgi:RNA polymerase primary sigma factor
MRRLESLPQTRRDVPAGFARIRRARHDHLQSRGAEPTDEELSSATGLSVAQLETLQATQRTPRSMEEQLGTDDGFTTTIGETIVDPRAEQAYQQVLDDLELRGVSDLTETLEERERTVVAAHYGLGTRPQTLSEIGAGLGLTAERARQIEAGALGKLRAALV